MVRNLYPSREYSIWITASGYGDAQVNSFAPLPAEAIDLKQFHLLRADSKLVGTIKDEQGNVVPSATVGVMDMVRPYTTTDAAGLFEIDRVPKGSHRMYAERGRLHVDFELVAGKPNQVVILSKDSGDGLPVVVSGADESAPSLKLGSPAMELETATWLNSKPLRLSQLRGKIIVLDFWGIWCRPCVEALPGVEKIAKKFGGQVVVIGIHDSTGVPSRMAEFAKKKGLTYALTIDRKTPTQTPGATATKYRTQGFPFIVIIDKTGKVIATPPNPERAAAMIAHLLKS